MNFPDLFATPDAKLDKRWIFKLPFKFVRLFKRSKRRIEPDPWLDAFLELTKAAEKIVAQKDATSEDWKKAWDAAFQKLKGKIVADDTEEAITYGDFVAFVGKVAIRQGWEPPTRDEITCNLEKLGDAGMTFKIESIYDIGRYYGWKEGKQKGEQRGEQKKLREMLEDCLTLRFPRITSATVTSILSIPDADVLKSIFKAACTADSLDHFQRDIRGLAPIN